MRPSSISSSERRAPRRWRLFFLVVLVVLAAAESALRLASVRLLLPPRSHFYHPAIARRLDALELVLGEHKRLDVIFIGSSIVLTNVDPVSFDERAGAHGDALVSFNAGLAGLWPRGVELYARHVWLPSGRPRVVVQGIRYPELAATTEAKNETQVWTGRIEPAWRDADLLTRLDAAAVSHVRLLQYHGVLTRVLQELRNGWTGPVDPEEGFFTYAVRGYQPLHEPEETAPEDWDADLPNEGTCNDGRCDAGFDALRRTIAAARAAGSAYILVNVPEHASRWSTPDGPRRYRHYVECLRAFAADQDVLFLDPTDADPLRFQHARYNDLSHLTAAGARLFTRALADRLVPVIRAARPGDEKQPDTTARAGLVSGLPRR